MGGVDSKEATCKQPLPQELCAITLSDAAVQRIPQSSEEGPGEKEQRKQNIDDYWRERMECLDNAYSESVRLTEREFHRLESAIKNMAPGAGKFLCPRLIEDATTCYLTHTDEPMICTHIIKKLELCLDTIIQEKIKKANDEIKRRRKKKC